MALTATVYRFQIELSDTDRGVYQALDLRVAQHPSESMPYLLARVIAYCLCFEEGIAFSKGGLSDPDEPALSVRDLQGTARVWIEIGTPSADRLHKASKAVPRVVVFTHHDPKLLERSLRDRPIHRVEDLELYALDPAFLADLELAIDRSSRWALVHTGGELYVTVGERTYTTALTRLQLEA